MHLDVGLMWSEMTQNYQMKVERYPNRMEQLTVRSPIVLTGKTILITVHTVTYYLELHNTMSYIINVIFCQVKM
jgi:hypothetical protein